VNLETTKAALALLERGEKFAWVTILNTHGSSPRHSGAAMVVRFDGSISGTIGGGPLEATAIKDAVAVVETGESRLSEFDSPQLGMMCGGGGLVSIEHVDPARGESVRFFRGLLELLQSGGRGWLVTSLPAEAAGPPTRKCLVGADGSVIGDAGCDPELLRGLANRGGTYDRIVANSSIPVYIQSIGARGTAYIFGAGHCGEKLAPVLSLTGFAVVVVDDRADFANPERFPTADRLVVPESFAGVVGTLPLDERSYVVIVTRGHSHDKSVLEQALRTPAAYIGMIGSRNKVTKIFEALLREGFTSEDLARVHAPIGLPIGAETPEEIAISIAAEVLQVRASKGA
jgi:xanthine dehydrogenase accessory factor